MSTAPRRGPRGNRAGSRLKVSHSTGYVLVQVSPMGCLDVGVFEIDQDLVLEIERQRDLGQRLANLERASPQGDDGAFRNRFTDTVADDARRGTGWLLEAKIAGQRVGERETFGPWQDVDE
jgi:hypothetical protein